MKLNPEIPPGAPFPLLPVLGLRPSHTSASVGYWAHRLRSSPFGPRWLELVSVTYTQKGPHHHITTPTTPSSCAWAGRVPGKSSGLAPESRAGCPSETVETLCPTPPPSCP